MAQECAGRRLHVYGVTAKQLLEGGRAKARRDTAYLRHGLLFSFSLFLVGARARNACRTRMIAGTRREDSWNARLN